MGHASYPRRRHGSSLLVLSGTCWPAHDTPARHRVPFSVAAYARGLVDQRRSSPTAQDDRQDKNTNSLVVIAFFSSQFELEGGVRGVRLSMDLSVARGRPGDGSRGRSRGTSRAPLGRELSSWWRGIAPTASRMPCAGLSWPCCLPRSCRWPTFLAGVRQRRLSDQHVGGRHERPLPLLVGVASVVVGVELLIQAGAPRELIALEAAMAVGLGTSLLVTLAWKI